MRFVTFKRSEDDTERVGILKGDKLIDLSQWISITVGTAGQLISENIRLVEQSDHEWLSRYKQRNEIFQELAWNSALGQRLASSIEDTLSKYGKQISPDTFRPTALAIDLPEPFNMLALIEAELDGDLSLDLTRLLLEQEEDHLIADELLLPLSAVTLLPPIPRPPKHVLCLGRNYAEHAAESTRAFGEVQPVEKPAFPAIFTKAPTAITGPYSDIPYDPHVSTQIDWEGELAVVIGKAGKNIRREDAMRHVFGYTVLNDISARDIQKRHGGQFFKGKSLDGSCPTGPWIVTADEIPDPHNLELTVRVNGVVKQHDNTRSMLFDIPEIIEHLSLGMTLEPGDIIATGTPAGVGHARTPPEFLRPGDIVEVEIEHIGTIKNRIAEA